MEQGKNDKMEMYKVAYNYRLKNLIGSRRSERRLLKWQCDEVLVVASDESKIHDFIEGHCRKLIAQQRPGSLLEPKFEINLYNISKVREFKNEKEI